MIRFRTLRRSDVSEVQGVARKAFIHTYRKIESRPTLNRLLSERYSSSSFEQTVFPSIRRGDSQFYLAIDGRKVIGFSNVRKYRSGWELYRIYLLPEYIGKGVGKKLLLLGEQFFRKKRARKYHVYVFWKNKLGLQFYFRNGFVRMKRKDRGRLELWLEKKL